ncbi:MAG: GNAT family N-acetyltransferase [Lachnospiraceae bacterium]|nr:GNAT family N-acetyltransferase [Lachnospiraceae bacterium]
MIIKYFSDDTISEKHRRDVDFINETCLSNDSVDPDIDMYDWEAPEDGKFLLFDNDRVVGRVAVHKTMSEYNGESYCLGGFGGLAVLPEYRSNGYGRKLAELALSKAGDLGVDVACMCVNMESGITEFYKRLGFVFLNRPAYFVNWADKEKTDDTVMIMGINNPALAEKILNTEDIFAYGKNKGHW